MAETVLEPEEEVLVVPITLDSQIAENAANLKRAKEQRRKLREGGDPPTPMEEYLRGMGRIEEPIVDPELADKDNKAARKMKAKEDTSSSSGAAGGGAAGAETTK